MNSHDAKSIIECLRAGIAASAVSELFSHGQGRITGLFQEQLNQGAGALAVEGGYGQGKTHLLKHLAQLAKRRGFVVSLVSLSKETPFHQWWHLYGAAIAQAERPDAPHEVGIRGLFRRQKWGDEVVQPLYEFAQELHPRLSTAIRTYYESRDGELQHRVLSDLMGHALTNGELSRIYRDATTERVKLPAARLAHTGRDYFAFAGKLFQLAGYAGWVILFDEFELVCKLSSLQRARAYANVAAFREAASRPGFERIASVFAFIPGMITEYLVGGTADLTNLPNTLRARGLEEEAIAADATLRWLVEQRQSLALLSESDTVDVLDKIAGLHEQAYAWRRPPADESRRRFYVPSMSAAERMRTKVRFCVEALDLAYTFRELPTVQTHEIALPRLEEDPELFGSFASDTVVEDVDR